MWIVTESRKLIPLESVRHLAIKHKEGLYRAIAESHDKKKLELQSFKSEDDAIKYIEYIKKFNS